MFTKEYWDQNYAKPETMDCIGNARQHCRYLKAFFELELIDVSSIIDLGFGYGYLFQRMLKTFLPYRACGIEPSKYAFDKARRRKLQPVESTKLTLFNESIQQWCDRPNNRNTRFDLGLCTSILQYIPDEELPAILHTISQRVKYLYLTVPTDKELDHQIENLNFDDTYALRRSREWYQDILGKSFTNISSKVWESKYYFNEETTLFSDLLYRS